MSKATRDRIAENGRALRSMLAAWPVGENGLRALACSSSCGGKVRFKVLARHLFGEGKGRGDTAACVRTLTERGAIEPWPGSNTICPEGETALFSSYRWRLNELCARRAGRPTVPGVSPLLKDGPMTVRERSYDLYGDDKLLERGSAGGLAPEIPGLGEPRLADLDIQQSSFPAFHLVKVRGLSYGTYVLTENFDLFDQLRRRMDHGAVSLLGEPLAGAVYTAGTAAFSMGRLASPTGSALLDTLAANDIPLGRCAYVGDIDTSGVYQQQMIEERFGIPPHAPLYASMLSLHEARRAQGRPCDAYDMTQGAYDLNRFVRAMEPSVRREASYVLAMGYRIPQEIVTGPWLDGHMGFGDRRVPGPLEAAAILLGARKAAAPRKPGR